MFVVLAEVRAAATFLTRLPLPGADDRAGAAAFGLVGAGIGLIGAVPLVVLGGPVPLVAAVLGLALVVLISGAVHLDGLADTADALAAPSPDAAERARTDPRLGSGGVAAVVLDLLLAVAGVATLAGREPLLAAAALVVAVTVSRSAAPVAAASWARFGSADASGGGAGRWFVRRTGLGAAAAVIVTSLLVVAGATALAGPAIALGSAWGTAIGAGLGVLVVGWRGQLDGDGYGALTELTSTAVLVGVAVAGSLA